MIYTILLSTSLFVQFMIQFYNPLSISAESQPPHLVSPPPEEYKPIPVPQPEYLGEFKLTFYDADKACTGKNPGGPGYGITKTGVRAQEGITIAADPRVLPLGTQVFIEGVGVRTVQDTGNPKIVKGHVLDVYVPTHKEALQKGVSYAKVYKINLEEVIH